MTRREIEIVSMMNTIVNIFGWHIDYVTESDTNLYGWCMPSEKQIAINMAFCTTDNLKVNCMAHEVGHLMDLMVSFSNNSDAFFDDNEEATEYVADMFACEIARQHCIETHHVIMHHMNVMRSLCEDSKIDTSKLINRYHKLFDKLEELMCGD